MHLLKVLVLMVLQLRDLLRVTEADMLAKPDPASFSILPWRTESPGAARMFCDIALPDGSTSLS